MTCGLCCFLKTADGRGHGAGLESAEAGGRPLPGRAAELHRPHQLLAGLHPGSHSGSGGSLRHTPPTKVSLVVFAVAHPFYCARSRRHSSFFAFQVSGGLHHGHPQPGLHTPFLSVSLPRAAGNARELPGRLDALPFSHLPGDSGPLSLRLSGLPTHRPAGLPMLAALLEHPVLEVNGRHMGLMATLLERD